VDQVAHARGTRSARQDRRALLGAEVRQFIFRVSGVNSLTASAAGTLTTGMAVIAGRCFRMLDFARRM
jgi:hypothetical protein